MRFAILENGKLGAAVEGELGRSMLRKKGVQAVRGKFNVEDGKPRIGIHCELIGGATDDLRRGFERRNCNQIVVVVGVARIFHFVYAVRGSFVREREAELHGRIRVVRKIRRVGFVVFLDVVHHLVLPLTRGGCRGEGTPKGGRGERGESGNASERHRGAWTGGRGRARAIVAASWATNMRKGGACDEHAPQIRFDVE